jgi:conjugal transfer pilus assembly protein TraW
VRGQIWEIVETDLLVYIKGKAAEFEKSGKLAKWQDDAETRARSYVETPNPVTGITDAIVERSRLFDPTITVRKDILDHQSRVIARAGTTVNPLDYLPMSTSMIFINGDDPAQVEWALGVETKNKIILTSGPVANLMRHHKRALYFDQKGLITGRFGITTVPATVIQEGRALRVREFPLSGENEQ